MIRKLILAFIWGSVWGVNAQQTSTLDFCSPFDFPLLLSANFGELRPNHFHNGLDIKTQGVTGKPVKCIADGYVARVAVSHGGYGQAIYVVHPNGLTSVYGHVVSFARKIQAEVRKYQYENETFVCDLSFSPDQFPVKRGEVIALSGNEGSSAGPHLHLELRKTDTGEYIDPMPYFKSHLKDSKAPRASLVAFYPVKARESLKGLHIRSYFHPKHCNSLLRHGERFIPVSVQKTIWTVRLIFTEFIRLHSMSIRLKCLAVRPIKFFRKKTG